MSGSYRPETDGLRALAVSAVILSNMGNPIFDVVRGRFWVMCRTVSKPSVSVCPTLQL